MQYSQGNMAFEAGIFLQLMQIRHDERGLKCWILPCKITFSKYCNTQPPFWSHTLGHSLLIYLSPPTSRVALKLKKAWPIHMLGLLRRVSTLGFLKMWVQLWNHEKSAIKSAQWRVKGGYSGGSFKKYIPFLYIKQLQLHLLPSCAPSTCQSIRIANRNCIVPRKQCGPYGLEQL